MTTPPRPPRTGAEGARDDVTELRERAAAVRAMPSLAAYEALVDDLLAALCEAGPLDAAWATAERALPGGWRMTRLNLVHSPSLRDWFWQAMAERFGAAGATDGVGPTPAAALQALAHALGGHDDTPD